MTLRFVALALAVLGCSGGGPTTGTGGGGGGSVIAGAPANDTVSYSGALPTSTGYATLQVGGVARRVFVHVPAQHGANPPLVLAFHGTGGNVDDGAHEAAMAELGVREAADAHGFIVVAPFSTNNGGTNADHESGGDGWRFDGDATTNGDLLLVRAALQDARRAFNIDATRVYAVGHSNGAFFTWLVASKLNDRVAAFAENAGGLIPCGQRVDCAHAVPGATSCSAVMASAPSACTCAIGATPFPSAKPGGRVPPGFLSHHADDSIVSPVFTCRLAEHLGARAQTSLRGTGDHGVAEGFMEAAWTFFSTRTLAD